MSKTVLLWHSGQGEKPGGGTLDHFDWLIERPGDSAAGLLTFRVLTRIDQLGCERFAAERIADHRKAYLAYEGPVSGGRGEVARVAAGECEVVMESDTQIEVVAVFGGRRIRYTGRVVGPGWVFEVGTP